MGCCLERTAKDGEESFSKNEDNVRTVLSILKKNTNIYFDLKYLHDEKGWRMHHSFKEHNEENYWLSEIVGNKQDEVLTSDLLSISENALKHNNNYIYLFSNDAVRKNLIKVYENKKRILILDNDISLYINKCYKESNKTLRPDFEQLKNIFEITSYEAELDNVSIKSTSFEKKDFSTKAVSLAKTK